MAVATMRVLRAHLLAAIGYGQLAFPGKLEAHLDHAQCKAYKLMLGIAVRSARVRAELGLVRQDLQCKVAFINYYLATIRVPVHAMKSIIREIFSKRAIPGQTI